LPGGKKGVFHVEHAPIQKLAAAGGRTADQLVTGGVDDLNRQCTSEVSPASWQPVNADRRPVQSGNLKTHSRRQTDA
jgi:hypothetical protein